MKHFSSASDRQLLEGLRAGQSAALEELFRRFYVDLCRRANRLLRDEDAAEDVVQEFFTFLWDRRAKLPESIDSVPAYLARAVRNRSLNYLRDRNRIPVDDAELPERSDGEENAEQRLLREELGRRITNAIDRLPERCRLVFVLSKVEGLSQREVSEQLSISTKTVENQMTRAYRFLKEWLAILLLCYQLWP